MPDKLADGGGHSPQTSSGFSLFSRQARRGSPFTIHKVVLPARIAPAASSFAGKRSAELRDNEIGGDGGSRTHSLNLARTGRLYDCHPQMLPAGVAPASFALEASRSLLLSYGSAKWSPAPVSHRANVVLQTTAFACSLARQWCGALVTLQAGAASDALQASRLFTGLSPRNGCGGEIRTHEWEVMSLLT